MENKTNVSPLAVEIVAGWTEWDNDDQIRMTELAKDILALRADAETSQNHNAAVIDPLIAQLRDAGYTGTLSEMIGQASHLKKLVSGETMIVKADGNSWCYVLPDFIDLQNSPAAFTDDDEVTSESGRVDYIYTVLTGEIKTVEGDSNFPLPIPPKGDTK